MELHLDEKVTESLRIKIKGTAGTNDIMALEATNQDNQVDEALCRQE